MSALFFVDHVVLIGRTREAANRLLTIFEKTIDCLKMEIYYTKTKFLEFHPENKNPLVSEIFEDETKNIEFELHYKYLGVELNIRERQPIFQEFYQNRLVRAKKYAGSIKVMTLLK